MRAASLRYILLITTLLVGAGLYAGVDGPPGAGTPRWPTDDGVYSANAWTVGPQQVERINTADFATRMLRGPGGANAMLTLATNQAPKLYAAGAEVPFLGSGYSTEPAPASVGPDSDGVASLVARRGTERWLVMYAYGERRGLLGNGPTAWALAVLDGLTGRPNDYYKLFLIVRADQLDDRSGRDIAELAHTVFPRIAAWYAA